MSEALYSWDYGSYVGKNIKQFKFYDLQGVVIRKLKEINEPVLLLDKRIPVSYGYPGIFTFHPKHSSKKSAFTVYFYFRLLVLQLR